MSNMSSLVKVMYKVVAQMSRAFIRDFNELQLLQSSQKPLDGFVNNTIKKVERIAITELQEARPRFGILSANIAKEGLDKDRWIISILDGYDNFSRSIPIFTCSIAVESVNIRGELEITTGVISTPILNTIYYAEKGLGAWQEINNQNANRMRVSSKKGQDRILLTNNSDNHEVTKIRSIGCSSLSLAYLASGKVDICAFKETNYIDIAAGLVMVVEAGGIIDHKSKQNILHASNS